jgi:hypothetical protein
MTATTSSSTMVSVYDGQRCIGFVFHRGHAGFETFDVDQRSLGMFPTQREATVALMERPQ